MLPNGPTSAQTWADLVRKEIDPTTLRQLVAELADAKRHADVIALLEQSILAGKGQPWMYEVLALEMELAGRPRAQIERVLLSSRDLTPADANSLLFLAAYLARFERYAQALRCCRQAAEMEPSRPEPYLEGMKFAQRVKDVDGMAWCAVGVAFYGWGKQRATHLAKAEAVVAEVRVAYQEQQAGEKLARFEQAWAEAQRVDLQLRLEWSGDGDLDFQIEEPGAGICSREHPYSSGGGLYSHDGYGPKPEDCFDEYLCPQAWSGEYRIRVSHSWGNIVGKRARITVTRYAGTPQREQEHLNLAIGTEDVVVRVSLKNGRRQQVATIVPAAYTQPAIARKTAKPTLLQQLPDATSAQLGQIPGGGNPGGGGVGAVGYQPVVQFFNEGVTMSALATVSGDRRYVRISTQPIFSSITDVFTFSFIR